MTKQDLIKAIETLGYTVAHYEYIAKYQELVVSVEGLGCFTGFSKQVILNRVKTAVIANIVPTSILHAAELVHAVYPVIMDSRRADADRIIDEMFFEDLSLKQAMEKLQITYL